MGELAQDYEDMRLAIRQNLDIIKDLVKQAEAYQSLINKLDDKEIRSRFEKNLKDIHQTIDSLIKQTEYIFGQYIELSSKNVGLVNALK